MEGVTAVVLLILFAFLSILPTHAQQVYALDQVIKMAQDKSVASKRAATQLVNKYWQFKTYRSNYLPQLALNGTLPNLNRSITSVTQNDGTELFVRRSLASSSLDLSLSQNVGLTGGQVFVSSQLQRIDLFGDQSSTSYLANPLLVGINQPLFQFNQLRWDKRIEPLKYEESQREFNENMENVALEVTNLYFDLLLAQINQEIAQSSLDNSDTLYKIAEGRYNLGKIAENDLLQMKLSLMNSNNEVSQSTLDIQLGTMRLKNYLNLLGEDAIVLTEPDKIPDFEVTYAKALEQARLNRKESIGFERQKLEADMNLAQAKQDNGVNVDLYATYGLTQSSTLLENSYENPLDQERVTIGLQVPILDWGRAKSKIRTAQANRDLVDLSVQQSNQQFEQEIFLLATQFEMIKRKLDVAKEADTIAQKRYDITRKRYLIGKVDILDLNIALEERISAKRSYVRALRDFWTTYFDLRRKTLYDFTENKPIDYHGDSLQR